MGTIDGIIRVLVVVAILVMNYQGMLTGIWATVAGIIGGVFLLTSILSFCPIYKLLGLSTCRVKK